jgi:uncharacterized protein (UPF0248 family)
METLVSLIPKTLVFDVEEFVDDQPFLNKIREAFEKGWYIVIHTSRGEISTNGNSRSIELTVKKEIQRLCESNNIPYHRIVVGKPVGAFYISNSTTKSNQFLSLDL